MQWRVTCATQSCNTMTDITKADDTKQKRKVESYSNYADADTLREALEE